MLDFWRKLGNYGRGTLLAASPRSIVSLDALLKKYSVYVLLALVAAIAFFQAAGTTQLVGAALISHPSKAGLLPNVTLPAASAAAVKDAEPILSRNVFDSVTGPLNKKPLEEITDKPPALDLSDPLGVPQCEGVRAAIISESTDPKWSVAALAGTGETTPKMRRVGDDVNGKTIAYIGFNPREQSPSVWLEAGATLCQVFLFPRVAPPAAAQAAPDAQHPAAEGGADSAAPRGPAKIPAEIADKIQKVSDTEFKVDRSVVDKVLENQAELMRSARIIPETKDGQVVGVRLFGIRPDTLLGSLGIQNGDRLETINGFSMSSPEKALEAYTRLRAADGLKLQVNRRGQPTTIDIQFK